MMKKALFIFSYNSYLRTSIAIADCLKTRGVNAEFCLYDLGDGKKQIAVEGNFFFDTAGSLATYLTADRLAGLDVVFFAFGGPELKAVLEIFHKACADMARRPAAVTLYPGIRAPQQIEGFSVRAASDIILFNSVDDIEEYRACCKLMRVPASNGLLFGLPVLASNKRFAKTPRARTGKIYFIDQGIIPRGKRQKQYLADKLVEYATAHPDRKLHILLKNSDLKASAHKAAVPIEDLIAAQPRVPGNLMISAGPVADVFECADLCITVSSTVAMECLALGIPAALISDFGYKFDLGNGHYLGSGLETSLDDIIADKIPAVNLNWAARHLVEIEGHVDALMARVRTPMISAQLLLYAQEFDIWMQNVRKKEFSQSPLPVQAWRFFKKMMKRFFKPLPVDVAAVEKTRRPQ